MTPEAADKLNKFFRTFDGGGRLLLLLDYDGTLAPFRVDRFQARPWAGVRELLRRIQRQGRTRMAVITRRPAAEIAPMLMLHPIDQDLSMGARPSNRRWRFGDCMERSGSTRMGGESWSRLRPRPRRSSKSCANICGATA